MIEIDEKAKHYFILCASVLLLSACGFGLAYGHGLATTQFAGRVISIADGDTVTVLAHSAQEIKIRLYGIDCPESKQPFGARAKQVASGVVFGKAVIVQPVEIDRYHRTVAIVFTSAKETLNEILVRDGVAWVYPQYCKLEEVCSSLRELEQVARSEKKGLWADKEQVPPWEWRKR